MNAVTVLGGGIAGVSAAYHANARGYVAKVFEATAQPGGLVSNFSINGFSFDNAIHMSFTKNEYVKSLFETIPCFSHRPDAYCKDGDYWMKHPVQNNLYPLPLDEKISLINSFVNRPQMEPENYDDWLLTQYGEEFTNRYPKPYTHKYWGLPPDALSLTWIGERMRQADFNEILAGAMEKKDDNHYYATVMRYPENGGYYSFIKPLVEQVDIQCNKKVVGINIADKKVYFDDGTNVEYDQLISSLPLPVICDLIDECPETVVKNARSLLWTTVDLVSVGFSSQINLDYLWFYIYDDDCIAARGYSPSIKSTNNAPKGKSSLQFEIYNLSNKNRLNRNELIANVKAKLLEMNICKAEDIEFMHHKHLPFGNVVFDHGMEERRQVVLDFLAQQQILTCGRFGEWAYFWSDESLLSGKQAAAQLK